MVPMTSLRSVRSTCKKWNALSKTQSFAKAVATRQQFLGFMMMSSCLCSLRLNLHGILKDNDGDFVAPCGSIKEISVPNQVDISNIFHCDGLLLCVIKSDSRLLVWNPLLGQTRWIQVPPGNTFNRLYMYSLGYDNNRNHKILSYMDGYDQSAYKCDIYDFNSNSWKVLDVTPEWNSRSHQKRRCVFEGKYLLLCSKGIKYKRD